jgi:two-component system sensor histidine kinase KdpD
MLDLITPEQRAQLKRDRTSWSEQTVSGYETVLLTRDGLRIPVLISSRPLFEDGRFAQLLCVFTDITQRRQAEEALRRHNEQLVTLNAIASTLSHSPNRDQVLDATLDEVLEMTRMDAGWIHLNDVGQDGQGSTLVAHRGISKEMIERLMSPELGRHLIEEVIRSREPRTFTGSLTTSHVDDTTARLRSSWTVVAIPIQARDIALGALSVGSNGSRQPSSYDLQTLSAIGHQVGMAVENLRLLEEAAELEILRELSRFRSELVANVSHELRTPLGLIKIFCTTLMREDIEFDRQTQLEFLRDIEQETNKLEEIVINLLDVSRMESGRLRLDKCPTDVGRLTREVMSEIESQLTLHRFVHDFPAHPLIASIDRKRTAQVLRNLLSNAIKYSPKGGTITVQGRGGDGQIVVCVSDQGVGIGPSDLTKVFERFYRVESEETRGVGGIGLGLAVCQGIVEAHGGRIWVDSRLGTGSDFYFSVPIGAAPELPLG